MVAIIKNRGSTTKTNKPSGDQVMDFIMLDYVQSTGCVFSTIAITMFIDTLTTQLWDAMAPYGSKPKPPRTPIPPVDSDGVPSGPHIFSLHYFQWIGLQKNLQETVGCKLHRLAVPVFFSFELSEITDIRLPWTCPHCVI